MIAHVITVARLVTLNLTVLKEGQEEDRMISSATDVTNLDTWPVTALVMMAAVVVVVVEVGISPISSVTDVDTLATWPMTVKRTPLEQPQHSCESHPNKNVQFQPVKSG